MPAVPVAVDAGHGSGDLFRELTAKFDRVQALPRPVVLHEIDQLRSSSASITIGTKQPLFSSSEKSAVQAAGRSDMTA